MCSKSCYALIVNVYSEWIHRSHQNIYPQIKLMIINQKWVGNVLGDDTFFIIVHCNIVQIINDIDSFSLWALCRFYYPKVVFFHKLVKQFLAAFVATVVTFVNFFILLDLFAYLVESLIESSLFIRQIVCFRSKIKLSMTELSFHVLNICSEPIFSS